MVSKFYEVLYSDFIIMSKVIKRSGTFIIVPRSWLDKECYIFYPDHYIERKLVKKNKYGYAFVSIAPMYFDQYLLSRLK